MSDRKFERVALALEVEYRNAAAFLISYSTNLSKGGMFVETEEPLPVGTEVALRFAIPGEPHIDVIGIVAWVQAWKTQQQPRGMGIRFDQLEEQHGEAIDRIVSGFQGLRALVMSADVSARGQLARQLRTIVGSADVVEAAGGEDIERALERDCDLLLVEFATTADESQDGDPGASLPGGYAEQILSIRLAKAHRPPVPVLALAHEEARRALAVELGADVVLPSPPNFADLQTAVLRLLGKPKSAALK